MVVQLKWPILGIVVPSLLISTIGYGTQFFVLRHHATIQKLLFYQACLAMIWISYILAIKVDPGSPPKNFQPNHGEWRRWCKICKNYKPERTHHCKTCKKCVLKMDHHCPWTYSCVGHRNVPHFMRFLIWVVFTTGYTLFELTKRIVDYFHNRELPSYLIDKKEVVAVLVLWPLDFFVFLTITLLLIRCLINLVFRGMTQIEVWEKERLESQFHTTRFWIRLRRNYFKVHGKHMPKLTSWTAGTNYVELDNISSDEETNNDIQDDIDVESSSDVVPDNFTIDDIVFPYDNGIWSNVVSACGYPWMWLLPWGGPRTSGYHFIKNDQLEDQLDLPWPPDGGDQGEVEEQSSSAQAGNYRDKRSRLKRTEWFNDMGESLADFGVDLDAEDEDNDDIVQPSRSRSSS